MFRIVPVALAVAAVLMPSPASAEKWTSTDAHQDVDGTTFSPEPEPCGTVTDVDATTDANDDLVALTVRHTAHALLLKARFRDLDAALEQDVEFRVLTPDQLWDVDVERYQKPSGDFRVFGFIGPIDDTAARADDCGTTTGSLIAGVGCKLDPQVDTDADTVRARIARACISGPRWVKVGVAAYGWTDSTDPSDATFTVYSDDWQTTDALGPRVVAGTSD